MKIQNPKSKIQKYSLLLIVSLLIVNCSYAMAKPTQSSEIKAQKEVFLGVFREGAPANMGHINNFVRDTGFKPSVIMWYQDWNQNFPRQAAMNVINYGAVPHIVWEPWYWSNHSKIQLQDIIDGKWDNYIKTWAQEIRSFGHPIFLRVAHEFNIEGYPWGLVNSGKDPKVYIDAYRHVVDIFKQEKADNAIWVWCFMNYSYPKEAWNDWVAAYPGDKYVDWIGIDGYNWGSTKSWSNWEEFKHLFRDQARLSKKLWPTKPIMVAEFSSAEKGGDKAEWIKQIPDFLKTSMRDIDMIIWFDIRKEADWRVKSSKKSAAAFKEIVQDPIFSSSGTRAANFIAASSSLVRKKAVAAKAPGAINIDGNLSDWNKSYPITMKDESYFKEGFGWSGLEDLSGVAYVMWDAENIYFAVEVDDKIPLINDNKRANIWDGDCIEIVLGFKSKNKDRTHFTSGDYQIGLGTGNNKGNEPTIWNWQRRRVPAGSDIAVVEVSNPQGYVIEAKITWKFFRLKAAPAPGNQFGFDIAFDDADYTGEREKQFIWNGDYYFYKDPSVWGILEIK